MSLNTTSFHSIHNVQRSTIQGATQILLTPSSNHILNMCDVFVFIDTNEMKFYCKETKKNPPTIGGLVGIHDV